MRGITVLEQLTFDGVIQAPGRADDLPREPRDD